MRIAVGQVPFGTSITGNVAAAAALAGTAAASGASVLVLPELALSGYRPEAAHVRRNALEPRDTRLAPLSGAATGHGITVLAGAAVRTADDGAPAIANSVLAFSPDGTVNEVYRKVHLWGAEKTLFTPGSAGAVLHVEGISLGLGICYDAGFPAFVRRYRERGVQVLVFASAFALGAERLRYDIYHPARALETGAYLLVSNVCGRDDETVYFGGSAIFDPQGQRLSSLDAGSAVATADIDPSEVRRVRTALPYQADGHDRYPAPFEKELP